MKLISFSHKGQPSYGLLTETGIIDLKKRIENENGEHCPDLKSLLSLDDGLKKAKSYLHSSIDFKETEVTFLPVIPNPNKILCAGMNYAEKRVEFAQTNEALTLFIRFPDSQTGHNTAIIKPAISDELDYEGELAVIIGKTCNQVKPEEALSYVAGYSCYMDGSIRDWQYAWFTAGKNWPKTGGFGPCLVTADEIPDPTQLEIKTYLNDQEMQNDRISNLVHSIPDIIAYISTFTSLSAGDVILTGSPGGVGKKRHPPIFMKAGDKIEVEITNLGRLTNFIEDQK